MAKRSALFLRIVEGKNLPIKDITGNSDPYCIVRIDNEAIIRTATIWKTLSPFWGEEYNVHVPPSFHTVSLYVMDEDNLSRDDVIGKVSISKEALAVKPQAKSNYEMNTGNFYTSISSYPKDFPSGRKKDLTVPIDRVENIPCPAEALYDILVGENGA